MLEYVGIDQSSHALVCRCGVASCNINVWHIQELIRQEASGDGEMLGRFLDGRGIMERIRDGEAREMQQVHVVDWVCGQIAAPHKIRRETNDLRV